MTKRVIVTGGSGLAGKWVVEDLVQHGYEVLNLDRVPMAKATARTLITDLTDAGQVFNALASSTTAKESTMTSNPSRSTPSFISPPFRAFSSQPTTKFSAST